MLLDEIEYLDRAIQERKKKLPITINCYKDYLMYFIRDYCIDGLARDIFDIWKAH